MHTGKANLKTHVNKNSIEPKIGGHPRQVFLKALTPLRDFGKKTSGTPSPGFSTRVHLWKLSNLEQIIN
jgi:hypothetical protein